jgi:hypothetical protein
VAAEPVEAEQHDEPAAYTGALNCHHSDAVFESVYWGKMAFDLRFQEPCENRLYFIKTLGIKKAIERAAAPAFVTRLADITKKHSCVDSPKHWELYKSKTGAYVSVVHYTYVPSDSDDATDISFLRQHGYVKFRPLYLPERSSAQHAADWVCQSGPFRGH